MCSFQLRSARILVRSPRHRFPRGARAVPVGGAASGATRRRRQSPARRAAPTHSVCAWRRRSPSPSGAMCMCGLIACSCRPQSGQRYEAGLRLWALRAAHQRASSVNWRFKRSAPGRRLVALVDGRAERDEGQPVGPGDGQRIGRRVEADEPARLELDLVSVDPQLTGTGND